MTIITDWSAIKMTEEDKDNINGLIDLCEKVSQEFNAESSNPLENELNVEDISNPLELNWFQKLNIILSINSKLPQTMDSISSKISEIINWAKKE